MKRTYSWALAAALTLCGAAAGCRSGNDNLPPGENGTRAGGNGAFGGDTAQPGEGTHDANGTGGNGNQMPMHDLH